jgi:hypothetical protein
VRAIQQAYFERLRATGDAERAFANGYVNVYGIAPDREWSSAERVRILVASRPAHAFGEFEMSEYFFPAGDLRIADFANAIFNEPESLSQFDSFLSGEPAQREFFVCTHGHVDICCAQFGVPLYLQARAAYPRVRAWRMTHFGGHRFAPTAWEFPSGYKWAFLDKEATAHVIERDVAPAGLEMKVRGWSGAPTRVQIVDREGLKRYGWEWLQYRRRGELVEDGGEHGPWTARVEYESPSGAAGVLKATFGVKRRLPLLGCGPTWGEGHGEMNEYQIESLTDTAAVASGV